VTGSLVRIVEDDLAGADVVALLAEHRQGMLELSPPESVHTLAIDALRAPEVSFWTAREGNTLLGCGALREIDSAHAEIKSMRTADAHRGCGVATTILEHLLDVAARRNYERLSLETGSGDGFEAAHALYLKFGFEFCGPFGDYVDDPFSRYMTRML